MINWLRRVDPAFYHKEPHVLRAEAQIARYSDDAQAAVRLSVLAADRILHATILLAALSAYAAVTGAGALDARSDWLMLWAFAVLAVAVPFALPWWPPADGRTAGRDGLIGCALVAIPTLWNRFDLAILIVAVVAGASLAATRDRGRIALIALAVGVLFGARVHPIFVAPLVGVLAVGAVVLGIRGIAPIWRRHPQVLTWSAFATLLVACAYTFAFDAPAVAPRVPGEIAALAVAYFGVCIIAGRIRRAELIAQPDGVLSIPQSIVPLLDRSHHHAVICWLA
jgi:hypothetical protein